jgi:hemolysin III
MKRTPLHLRSLPTYSRGEEQMNTITHAAGGILSIAGLVLLILQASFHKNIWGISTGSLYGASLIAMFTVSAVYHGLTTDLSKKVMQVIDHCTIYFLIAGTYTVIVLTALRPVYPAIAWGLFGFEWALAILATVLTAIDLKEYEVFSMICYIGMGWAVIPFWKQLLEVLSFPGFLLVLTGGIAYTIGSILYGLGARKKWMHSIFHIFVVLGALLQFFAVMLYVL